MDTLTILTAKYLIILSPLLAMYALYKAPVEKRREIVIFGAITLPLAYVLALIARHFWYDPRPFVVSGVTPLIPHAADNGFPSDHVLSAAALAAVVGYFNRKLAAILWLIAFTIGVARVAAGVHHAIDILGSIVVVLAAKCLARAIMPRLWNRSIRANS
ncbi:phosphatase PAP2 family protein [Candidatus Parcubacteria bacterium]|nr:phosphatase PAP2 family protein [Candidatus Parcubacteria bacterium]